MVMKNIQTNVLKYFILLTALTSSLAPFSAQAWEWMPTSRAQTYLSNAFITENQTMIIFQTPNRAAMSVATELAIGEFTVFGRPTQLVAYGSAFANFRIGQSMFLTETIDARAGLRFNTELNDKDLLSARWMHLSGHATDEIQDKSLYGTNLGNEILTLRWIRNWNENLRTGAGVRYTLGAEPDFKTLGGDQFIEYYFTDTAKKNIPYVLAGFEEYGNDKVTLSMNLQAGYSVGDPRKADTRQTFKWVAGYYDGSDLRLKYAQFLYTRMHFFYAGFTFSQ